MRQFINNAKGNTMVVFALSLFAIVGSIGAAIDFSNVYGVKSHLQDAGDSAVLVAALTPTNSEAQMKVIADKNFTKSIPPNTGTVTTTLTKVVTGQSTTINYTTTTTLPTYVLGLIGMDTLTATTLSSADATVRNSEIVFVLDSTGSMSSSSKMTNLKSSVDATLATFLDSKGVNAAGTKVAIIPFDTQVRVSTGTNYSYVDYGTASNSESCSSAISSSYCSIMIDSYDKVCGSSVNVVNCKSTAKLYYKTSKNGNTTLYQVYVIAYVSEGSGYRIYNYGETLTSVVTSVTPVTTTGTWCGENGCSTNTNTSSSTKTTNTLTAQSGTNLFSTALTTYNTTPSGYSSVNKSYLTYPISYGNGFGARAATQTSSTSGGVTKVVNLPAVPENKAAWTGCFIDRNQNYDVNEVAPSSVVASGASGHSLYIARNCSNNNLKTVMGLTTDITALRAKVQSLAPAGNTNVTIGIQWGMEALSANEPLTGAAAWNDAKFTKYMIIVTDGDNTQSRYSSTQSVIDARTALACTNAKAKGIIIFSVRVIQGNSTLLQNCASKPGYFYDLSSANQLAQTMTNILTSIKKVKLAK